MSFSYLLAEQDLNVNFLAQPNLVFAQEFFNGFQTLKKHTQQTLLVICQLLVDG